MSNFVNPWGQFIGKESQMLVGYYVYFGEPDQDPVSVPKDVFDTDGVNLGAVIQLDDLSRTTVPVDLSGQYSFALYTDLVGNGGALYEGWAHPNFSGLLDQTAIVTDFWEEKTDTTTLEPVLIMATAAAPVATILDYTQLRFGTPATNVDAFVPSGPDNFINDVLLNLKALDQSQWPTISNGTDTDHDIDFAAGFILDSTGAKTLAGSALTKQIDATWAAGDAAGGHV